MASEAERERIAIELKVWLRSQSRYKTIRELEGPTGIPYSSLRDYFSGDAAPVGERLQRLAALTRVPGLLALLPLAPPSGGGAKKQSRDQVARKILETTHRLMDELEFFKKGTAADRAVLRRVLSVRDVGYMTTLLKAIYDEDQFQTWLYFTEYKPEFR